MLTRFILVVPMAFALGCVGEIIGEEDSTVSISATTQNGLSINGLISQRRYLGSIGGGNLGFQGKESLNGLDPDQLLMNTENSDGLEATFEGRSLLKYISTCALPKDQELVVDFEDERYYFPGLLGLAPEWAEDKCDTSCQKWMSACLLAHTNPRGENVGISLRGAHEELTASKGEKEKYSFEEGSFYGQLFSEEIELFACVSDETMVQPLGAEGLFSRQCSRGDCGATFMGQCGSKVIAACATDEVPYKDCNTELVDTGNNRHYNEVVTVFLTPASSPQF